MDVYAETPELIPELDVTELEASIAFYTRLGFEVGYTRPNEGFAYLTRGGVHIMLQTADGPGRRLRTADLARPYGRGINFQLEVEDVTKIHDEVVASGCDPLIALEERWYVVGDHEGGNLQFVVADPDGYLWRPFEDLGDRPI
jgi:catechol 2,3-dioxygenase-like lactoylglutathione lyase family enzyme